jgi:hypothetical protein
MFYASRVLMLCMLAGLVVPLQAMEIQQFDKMADKDQDEYVGELVIRAEKVLRDNGKRELASQVNKLFTTVNAGSQISLGMAEFTINLARARVADLRNIEKDPNTRRLEVEHALIVMLKSNGIVLPNTIMTVMDNWKPKFPPKNMN